MNKEAQAPVRGSAQVGDKVNYSDFIARKLALRQASGLTEIPPLAGPLFPHQDALVRWALRRGRAAIFADTGLGKTRMQIAWANALPGRTLILAPLAVAAQTAAEGVQMGVPVKVCREASDVTDGINVTNYDRLHKFDPAMFANVVLDESSCIKHHDAKTFARLMEAFAATPFKLCATATPAPNDWTELGTHAEFLGVCSRTEMLSEYFVHDGAETQVWRLKGHAQSQFWRFVSTWGAMVRMPSDLGYDDAAYKLPALHMHEHIVETQAEAAGMLFAMEAQTLSERRVARKASIEGRVQACAEMVNADRQPWLIWCDFNAEGDALESAIPGSVQVAGNDSVAFKEQAAEWFIGSRCICNAPEFSSKLAEWRTQTTSGNTTQRTESGASLSLANTSGITPKKSASTTPLTTLQTKIASPLKLLVTELELQSSERPSGKPSTGLTQSGSSEQSRNGRKPIQKNDSTIACASTESPALTTTECLPNSAADALSAAQPKIQTASNDAFTSITATRQAESEGSCVQTATSDSESSRIQRDCSTALPCICGHASGRRVLVSKCSIFGYGLNFQVCARVAFVGVTDSYEAFYQAVRRCWRFGQKRDVYVHVFASHLEGAVLANLKRKELDSQSMAESLSAETRAAVQAEVFGTERLTNPYNPRAAVSAPAWLQGVA